MEKLLEKLAHTELQTSEFTTNKISLDGDMVLNGNSLSNSLYEKDQRTLTFDNVFWSKYSSRIVISHIFLRMGPN